MLSDWYWLCGASVYSALPADWTGVCALVALYDPTFVIPGQSTFEHLKQHVPRVQRSIAADNPVPETHRIWPGGEKVMQGLFPWIGVGEVYKEIKSTRYTLLQFGNSSILTDGSIRTELTALRLVVIQNRMVLDQLTAAQGGVCALVGEICCTYIPDNDADGQAVQQGIDNRTVLRDRMMEDEVDATKDRFFFTFVRMGKKKRCFAFFFLLEWPSSHSSAVAFLLSVPASLARLKLA